MAKTPNLNSPELYINRELSWLEFNDRVLREGMRDSVPLLERIKFLGIVSSNLDEFFMVRVGGLWQAKQAKIRKKDASGLTPAQQLKAIETRVRKMTADHCEAITEVLQLLAEEGFYLRKRDEWNSLQASLLQQYFQESVLPVLTPIAVDSLPQKPLLQGQRLHLAVRLTRPLTSKKQGKKRAVKKLSARNGKNGKNGEHWAENVIQIIPVPTSMTRLVSIPSDAGLVMAPLEEVMAANIEQLFPGWEVSGLATFRVTRDSDVAVDEDERADLLQNIEAALSERKRRHVVRMEIDSQADPRLKRYLMEFFEIGSSEVYPIDTILDARDLIALGDTSGFDHLKYEPWQPQPVADLVDSEDLLETLRERDILLSHPYETFDPVVQLVQAAADDPRTLAIKMVLYRTTGDSPIVDALMRAAQNGKNVTVLVELKARFDEARNVSWALAMEDAGCDVIYGISGLKTHAKVLLVVRREENGIRRYVHLATGNYNEKTARLYGDLGLMTTDWDICTDAAAFFNLLTGYSQPVGWKKLFVAPTGVRQRIDSLIEREIRCSSPQDSGLIIAKVNSLQCPMMCQSLYRASQAGVRVKLSVRGICCLRPGIKGVSENIEVTSIIDRYLEHARAFYFRGGGHEEVYLGSADWMVRNLDKRLEIMFPVTDPRLRARVIKYLETCMADNTKAYRLMSDGSYEPVDPKRGPKVRAQEAFQHEAVEAAESMKKAELKYRPRRKQRKGKKT